MYLNNIKKIMWTLGGFKVYSNKLFREVLRRLIAEIQADKMPLPLQGLLHSLRLCCCLCLHV
jgi:hypothetical protein